MKNPRQRHKSCCIHTDLTTPPSSRRLALALDGAEMTSLKDKFKSISGSGTTEADDASADKYKLRVTAGPSYNAATHKPLSVNAPEALYFENEYMRVKVKMRVNGGYTGLPGTSHRTSPYFDDPMHAKDQYSIGFSFVPKVDIPSLNTRWGNDLNHPVRDRLPRGFTTAFKIVKEFIDPGLSHDAYADEPWLLGPSVSCWFAFRIGDIVPNGADFPQPEESPCMKEGADGSGNEVREKHSIPPDADKRRKFFLSDEHRANFTFEKGRLYQGDFFNPYLDFNKLALRLPGFSLSVVKYLNDKTHSLRYVFKNVETGDLYFVVVLTLLIGQDAKDAVGAENQQAVAGSEHKAR